MAPPWVRDGDSERRRRATHDSHLRAQSRLCLCSAPRTGVNDFRRYQEAGSASPRDDVRTGIHRLEWRIRAFRTIRDTYSGKGPVAPPALFSFAALPTTLPWATLSSRLDAARARTYRQRDSVVLHLQGTNTPRIGGTNMGRRPIRFPAPSISCRPPL